jgi:hypothetical protein
MKNIQLFINKFLCSHKWEIHFTTKMFATEFLEDNTKPKYIRQTLICKNCGKIKQILL